MMIAQWDQSCSVWRDRQADRQTGMAKLIVDFRNFVNAFKNDKTERFDCVSEKN
jgi:hypothetical protein